MCKILVVPHVPKKSQDKVEKLFKAATPYMSENDKDGLGYSLMKADGSIFTERWLKNEQAWKDRQFYTKDHQQLAQKYDDFVSVSPVYNKEGTLQENDDIIAAFMHTRMATCQKGLHNTHPFTRPELIKDGHYEHNEIAMIHNGMIHNDQLFRSKMLTTCDSEAILVSYIDNYIGYAPERMQDVIDELSGYWAFSVMTKDVNDIPIVDIVKSDRDNLVVAYIKQLGAEVFCTNIDILNKICNRLKWTITAWSPIAHDTHMRFNALTGELIHKQKLSKYSSYGTSYNSNNYGNNVNPKDKQETKITKIAEVLAIDNAKDLTTSEKNDLKQYALGDLTDEEYTEYMDLKRANELVSDDPEEVAAAMRRIREAAH